MRSVLPLIVLCACNSAAPTESRPTIDCFGTPCSDTCCLLGDGAALCAADAAACGVCLSIGDAGSDAAAPDACPLLQVNEFQCFNDSDCPRDRYGAPQRCCFSQFFGAGTTCYDGFGDCAILELLVCDSGSQCNGGAGGACVPAKYGSIQLPFNACAP